MPKYPDTNTYTNTHTYFIFPKVSLAEEAYIYIYISEKSKCLLKAQSLTHLCPASSIEYVWPKFQF